MEPPGHDAIGNVKVDFQLKLKKEVLCVPTMVSHLVVVVGPCTDDLKDF